VEINASLNKMLLPILWAGHVARMGEGRGA
jgi:hypothetical protein